MQNTVTVLDSHCAINMMLIYKIMEVRICVSLHEHHDVTFAENDAAAYTLCLWPHLAFFYSYSTKSFTNLSQNNANLENRKINILIKNTLRALFLFQTRECFTYNAIQRQMKQAQQDSIYQRSCPWNLSRKSSVFTLRLFALNLRLLRQFEYNPQFRWR